MKLVTIERESAVYRALRLGLPVVLVLVALALPFQYEPFRVEEFTLILVVAIAVAGLNLLTGYTGQISLGHSAFFGIGAYTTAILVADGGWSPWATMPVGAGLAFAVGLLCGLPALRIRGLYLALVTLALAAVFPAILQRFESLTGGAQGKRVQKIAPPEWTGLAADQYRYFVVLAFAALTFLFVRNLARSRPGRALIAVRDNETAAEVVGVNLALYKTLAFGVSAAVAGVAGSLFTMVEGFVAAGGRMFSLYGAIELLAAMVIGGAATVAGPLFGAVVTQEGPRLLAEQDPALSQVLYGALLILLMLTMRDGIVGRYHAIRTRLIRVRRRPAQIPPATAPDTTGTGGTPPESMKARTS
jgi:branched-chain amino acid transport system permease protein